MKSKVIKWGLSLIGVILLYKSFTRSIYKSESIVLSADGISPSISSDDANTFANLLYSAMSGWGTDEDTILKVFEHIQNRADFVLLFNAFGQREYGTFGAPLYSWFPGDGMNLVGWLNHELSGNTLEYCLKYYNV